MDGCLPAKMGTRAGPTEIPTPCPNIIEDGYRQKRRQRSSLLFEGGGTELLQFFAALAIFHKDDLKKRLTVEWMLWKIGGSSGLHHTKPPPCQNGCSPKNFCSEIILAAK